MLSVIYRHTVTLPPNFKWAVKSHTVRCCCTCMHADTWGDIYLHCWLLFKAEGCNRLLGLISVNKKGQETVCTHLQPSDTRLWSDFSGSVLLPAGQFRSGLRLTHFHPHSLGNPSICILSLTSFLLPVTPWVLAPWYPSVRPSPPINTSLTLVDSIPTVLFSIPTSQARFWGTGLSDTSPGKKNLSDFPLVSAGPWELWFPKWIVYRSPA